MTTDETKETEQEHIARHVRTMQLQIEALAHLLEHVREIVANPAKAEKGREG